MDRVALCILAVVILAMVAGVILTWASPND